MADAITVQRYQPPSGDIYLTLESQVGTVGANNIAAAAIGGDDGAIQDAIETARGIAPPKDASTFDAFVNQIETNPLGAPVDALESQLRAAAGDFLTAPLVLGAIVLGLAIAGTIYFGGLEVIKAKVAKLAK